MSDPNKPIDGLRVPPAEGALDPDYLTRDIENDLEIASRAWIDRVAREEGISKRAAAARVLEALRQSAAGSTPPRAAT